MAMTEFICPQCGFKYQADDQAPASCPVCHRQDGSALSPRSAGADEIPLAAPPLPPPPPNMEFGQKPAAAPPPPPGYGASPAGGGVAPVLEMGRQLGVSWLGHAQRALAKHVRDINLSGEEQEHLNRIGVQDPSAQRHFAWRRSLIWFVIIPTAFTALLSTIGTLVGAEWKVLSLWGVLMVLVQMLATWGVPASAFLAAQKWDDPKRSRYFLLLGFLVSFLFPIVLGLFPGSWMVKLDRVDDAQLAALQSQMASAAIGLMIFLTLIPAILSLLPGTIRACIRAKVLLPESIVSGWLLMTVVPLYGLFMLTLFILINQLAGNFFLILGAATIVAAPLVYVYRMNLFVRPLWTDEDRGAIEQAQTTYQIVLYVGGALVLLYLLTGKLFGRRIIGGEEALVGFFSFMWNAIKFVVDYLGRSLFITAIVTDLVMMINVSAWRQTREFEASPHAAEYDKTITELDQSMNR